MTTATAPEHHAPVRRRLYLNAVSGVLLYAVSMAVAFIISPIMVRELGNRDYGVWDLLLSFAGYLGILEMGLGPAVMRYIAVAAREDDRRQLCEIFNSALMVFTLVGALCLAIASVLAVWPEAVLGVTPGQLPFAMWLFVLLGLNVGIQFPGTVLTGYIMGLQRHVVLNLTRCLLSIATAVGIYLALTRHWGPGLMWVAALTLASNVVLYGALAVWLVTHEDRITLGRQYFSWTRMKELYSFGMKSVMLMASDRLRRATMPLIITHIIGVNQIVYFSIPSRLIEYVAQFGSALGFPLTPYFSALSGERDSHNIRREWYDLARLLQFIYMGSAVGVGILGTAFIRRWMGEDYAVQGRWVVVWLACGLFVYGMGANATRLLVGLARQELAVKVYLPAGIITAIVAVPLAYFYQVNGVAFALFIAYDATILFVLRAACREIGITVWDHFRHTVLVSLLPLALMTAVLLGLCWLSPPRDYWQIFSVALAGGLAYCLAGWYLTLTKPERTAVRARVRQRLIPAQPPEPPQPAEF